MTEVTLESDHRSPTIGVFSIATNRYADYWMAMARTADAHLFVGHEVVLTVFTDRVDDIRRFQSELIRIKVQPIRIAPLGWPAAPLAKFRVVVDHQQDLGHDVLMHLDADMRVTPEAKWSLRPESWHSGFAVVQHPGFRRPLRPLRSGFYTSHPGFAARDLYRQAFEGGRGTWERDRRSTAYVARSKRSTYVCGATWFGKRQDLLEVCSELAQRVDADTRKNMVARFHDESHLNWYTAEYPVSIMDSDYCFVEGAANLRDLKPRVIAVEKHDNRTR